MYDLVIIGAGAGGLRAASTALRAGMRVAIVEAQPEMGGDCLHHGCVPSKALIKVAAEVHQWRKSARLFGGQLPESLSRPLSMALVKSRVRAAIETLFYHDSDERFEAMGADIFHARGEFIDATTLALHPSPSFEATCPAQVTGKHFIIATGSRPVLPPIPGLNTIDYLTNETLFDLEALPEHLVVVGGGVIGLELGQSFARLGSRVTVVEASKVLLANEEPQVRDVLCQHLREELSLLSGCQVSGVTQREGRKIAVDIQCDNEVQTLQCSHVLVAAGRRPTTDDLGLSAAGVNTHRHAIKVDAYGRTSQPHIFAVGDVNGQFAFTHAAGYQGKRVVENLLSDTVYSTDHHGMCWAIYTSPEVYHLGQTAAQLREAERNFHTVVVDPSQLDRFVTEQHPTASVVVHLTSAGEILGAHAVGEHASDWMQSFSVAMQNGLTLEQISSGFFPYPARTEVVLAVERAWRDICATLSS
ncbi:dihydrolipoyl dehydrogenase family protein [Thaumasiovibrio subtropicus]|uniref:dihydrolipoyl dehydrogenase family protein n=1 Tax=Thaumasiovibrio subtropicus TaxID=1891207 RepID=UPI00131BE299|nr:FAD-dependent oxidoreductase [Thaumasiovibrio subtropicus]